MSDARTVGVLGCFARAFAIGLGVVTGLTCGAGCIGGLMFIFQAVSENEDVFAVDFERELVASAEWDNSDSAPTRVCPNAVTPIPWQVQVAPRIQIPASPPYEPFPEQPPHPTSETKDTAQRLPRGNWAGPWVDVPGEPVGNSKPRGDRRVASKPADH